MNNSVYLDHNATSPLRPEAVAAIERAMEITGNGSSVHAGGRAARKVIEQARASIAKMCGAKPDQVTFTSGGTEANNLVISGSNCDRVLISAVEHPSINDANAPEKIVVPVTSEGVIDLDALEDILSSSDVQTLVSVMYANNETGVIQPIERVVEIARAQGAIVHCDAVQAVGKISFDVNELGAHLVTISSHKIGGPAGTGVLINVGGVSLSPTFLGGGQEKKVRSGTENLIGIAGFGAAAQAVHSDALAEVAQLKIWRDELESAVLSRVPDTRIIGQGIERLPNTACLVSPTLDSETQVMAMDLAGICISAGSACSSGKVGVNPVLTAMGFNEQQARSVVRVSLGWSTTQQDVTEFINAWSDLHERTLKRTMKRAS